MSDISINDVPLEISRFEESENKKLVIERLKSGLFVYTCENGIPIMVSLKHFEEYPEKRYYPSIDDCKFHCLPYPDINIEISDRLKGRTSTDKKRKQREE